MHAWDPMYHCCNFTYTTCFLIYKFLCWLKKCMYALMGPSDASFSPWELDSAVDKLRNQVSTFPNRRKIQFYLRIFFFHLLFSKGTTGLWNLNCWNLNFEFERGHFLDLDSRCKNTLMFMNFISTFLCLHS